MPRKIRLTAEAAAERDTLLAAARAMAREKGALWLRRILKQHDVETLRGLSDEQLATVLASEDAPAEDFRTLEILLRSEIRRAVAVAASALARAENLA